MSEDLVPQEENKAVSVWEALGAGCLASDQLAVYFPVAFLCIDIFIHVYVCVCVHLYTHTNPSYLGGEGMFQTREDAVTQPSVCTQQTTETSSSSPCYLFPCNI